MWTFLNKIHTELKSFTKGYFHFSKAQSTTLKPAPAHSLQRVHSFYLTQPQTSKRFLFQDLTEDPALPVVMVLPQAPLDCASGFRCCWWQLWRVLVKHFVEGLQLFLSDLFLMIRLRSCILGGRSESQDHSSHSLSKVMLPTQPVTTGVSHLV